ncbi:redoxin domain-containing protein [Taibaiella lutea]|uniref:Redoxin domain-containing protein n=1 Tax=Taibaiella lutea TaxID=2608001 RepID=A0A5M6CTX3_9BACT|nr:redoxin domain-containing protein [Taibaiella lutea]KAA5536619.1 redoxin domain-containing protein [Taibaiella lutea]
MALQIGDSAPGFTLRDSDKKEVSLQDYKGKNLVILFFPLAFTGVCTTELCSLRDNMNIYNGLNAAVVAISVDSLFTLDKFKQEQGYNFPLLSDFNKDVSAAYDSLYEDFVLGMKGVSKRSAFVVDKEGKIQYAEVLEDAGKVPDFDAIQNVLKTLN